MRKVGMRSENGSLVEKKRKKKLERMERGFTFIWRRKKKV
jgi:hypothetical protein